MTGGRSPLERLHGHLRDGDTAEALKLAARFKNLGPQRDRIQRGAAAITRPEFYRDLGWDPDALVEDGVAAVVERYGTEMRES